MERDYILVERILAERNDWEWKPVQFGQGQIVVYGNYEEAVEDKVENDLLCEVRYPAKGIMVLWWKFFGVEFCYDTESEDDYQRKLADAVKKLHRYLPFEVVMECRDRGLLDKQNFDCDKMFEFVWTSDKPEIGDILDDFAKATGL